MHLKKKAYGLYNSEANYEFGKKTSGLYNPKDYRGIFLEIQKIMEVREEHMEVQEEIVPWSTLYQPDLTWPSLNLVDIGQT